MVYIRSQTNIILHTLSSPSSFIPHPSSLIPHNSYLITSSHHHITTSPHHHIIPHPASRIPHPSSHIPHPALITHTSYLITHNSSTLRFHPLIPHHTNFLKFSAAFKIVSGLLLKQNLIIPVFLWSW